MPKPILSPRSRIPAAKADKLLKCYAERLPPAETAKRTGLSLNTVYDQYARIRWRLIEVGYYKDAALSKDEDGLSETVKEELRQRRGLEAEDIYAHAAEVIVWAEEWPPGTVLRHLRKVIELTGPLDVAPDLFEDEATMVAAYVRYARIKLIHDRVAVQSRADKTKTPIAERTREALNEAWRSYRAAVKQWERSKSLRVWRRYS